VKDTHQARAGREIPAQGPPEEAEVERSETGASGGGPWAAAPLLPPDPEVVPRARARTFSNNYKLRVLQEIDAVTERGQVAAILRREGLYRSIIHQWRKQREQGKLAEGGSSVAGPKTSAEASLRRENERLRKELERAQKRLRQTELLLEAQKKILQAFEMPLTTPNPTENA